jgi:hypothetical protein
VANGSFTVPVEGETSSNVWYRIILTATDANGLTGMDSVDVHPLTSTITLSTDPEGLQLTLDGQPVTSPFVFTSVEGLVHTIGAPSPQEGVHVSHTFDTWDDGITESTRTIATPVDDIVYVASYISVVSIDDLYDPLAAFPNPSRDGVIYLRANWRPPVKILMVDLLAKEVSRATWTDTGGEGERAFVYGKVNPGIYTLLIEQEGSRKSIRIQVFN